MQYAIQNKFTGEFVRRGGYDHGLYMPRDPNDTYTTALPVALFNDLTNARSQRTRLVNHALKHKATVDEMSNEIWRVVEATVVAGRAVA